ncbi:MAG: hypothetical protein WA957_11375 [Alteraurantiacibacter sp.]
MNLHFPSKAQLEKAVLYKLYVAINTDGRDLIVHDIARDFNPNVPDKRIKLALQSLEINHLIRSKVSNFCYYSITNKGIGRIEEEISSSNSFLNDYASRGNAALFKLSAPAADRIVRFDDNQPEAKEIGAKLSEVRDAVRGCNDNSALEADRNRIYNALGAAEQYWQAGEFRITQFKIGVLLAVEDASNLLKATAQAVVVDALVEALKAFAKTYLKFDVDS